MIDNTEPTIDEYLDRISELNKLGYPDLDGACNICGVHPDALKALIANQIQEAKLKELEDFRNSWHTMIRQEVHQDLNDRIAQLRSTK